MKKKMLLLSLVIPLVFIVGLLSIGKVAGIYVEIPASGIHITTPNDSGFIDIDMASYNDDLYINAQVEPTYSSNQKYNFEVEQVGENKLCDIDIAEDGKVSVNGDGKAKVSVISQDKGFKDSVILNVTSSKVFDVQPHIEMVGGENINLNYNDDKTYDVTLKQGVYDFSSVVYPIELKDSSIIWTTENKDIVDINKVTGRANVMLSGSTKVVATCPSGINGGVQAVLNINVEKPQSSSGLVVNGLKDNVVKANIGTKNIQILFEKTNDNEQNIIPEGLDLSYLQNIDIKPIEGSLNQYIAKITLVENHPNEINLDFTLGGEGEKSSLKLVFADFNMSVLTGYHREPNKNEILQKNNSLVTYVAVADPSGDDITYEWLVDNDNVEIITNGNTCDIKANALGRTTLVVNAYKENKLLSSEEKTIRVIRGVSAIDFLDNATTHGIENILAVGDTKLQDNIYRNFQPELKVRITYDDGGSELYSGEGLDFSSLDSNVIKPYNTLNQFKVKVEKSGVTKISAAWEFNEYFGINIGSNIKLRGVKDGVMINSDKELIKATNDSKPVILTNNIMLGHKGMTVNELNAYANEMPTSYDWKFYENKGQSQPSIKYLVEFKNDVFGNGYEINADNITQAKDPVGDKPLLFKGPLDFVSVATAAVKAQDNTVFLVRTKGITIDNIVLKNCLDESLYEDNNFDLRKLDYAGTTLDVMSDCNIYNSRLSNGRTVLRIFGGDSKNENPIVKDPKSVNANNERIKVNIESCILSNAREFILKIGSNRGVLAEGNSEDTFKQYTFKKANGESYNQYDYNLDDQYFYDNYVLTDVNLKNSVLTTSGLFSVGMETHFGGIMLAGFTTPKIGDWHELAATSFASVLNLEGDVKLLDWKNLDNVDSSTLIETTVNAQQFLTLDVKKMLEKAVQNEPTYKELFYQKDNTTYVHGGIAMYGGGTNYSQVTFNGATSEKLNKYRVNLSILAKGEDNDISNPVYLQGTMLPLAAGTNDFTFYMYNNKSENNINSQIDAIANGSAFKLPSAIF